jgi:hypothetical protein
MMVMLAQNSFESERLDTPGLERLMIVVRPFRVNLHAVAQLADMFVRLSIFRIDSLFS